MKRINLYPPSFLLTRQMAILRKGDLKCAGRESRPPARRAYTPEGTGRKDLMPFCVSVIDLFIPRNSYKVFFCVEALGFESG